MSNRLERGIRAALGDAPPHIRNDTIVQKLSAAGYPTSDALTAGERNAMKLSTVNRCIEILSDSVGENYAREVGSGMLYYPRSVNF